MPIARMPFVRPLAAVALCGATLACAPAAAAAATTATFDGTTTVVTGTGGDDEFSVSRESADELAVNGAVAGPGCEASPGDRFGVRCPLGPGGVRVEALGGNDRVTWTDWAETLLPRELVQISLGDGNDEYSSAEVDGPATVRGDAGNDEIQGSRQGDDLDGGPGMDVVRGFEGDDLVRGGEGDDRLSGDSTDNRGADLIDGGPGRDIVDDWGASEWRAAISMDGAANDGFPEEGDNVVGVEQIQVGAGLDFIGDDGENHITAGEVATTNAILAGRGGNDTLMGTDLADQLDGGPGDDQLIGGYGNDAIVGGPGQDTIIGDRAARCNEMHCDLDPGSAADTIDAVDGEVDTISCGPGNDLVRADAADRVDADCEQVVRVAASAPGAGTPSSPAGPGQGGAPSSTGAPTAGSSGGPAGNAPGLRITTTTLKTALRRGIKVRMTGLAAGRKLKLTATVGGRKVGSGSDKASKAGTATVTIRITKAGRRALAGRRSASVTVRGGGRTAKAKLRG